MPRYGVTRRRITWPQRNLPPFRNPRTASSRIARGRPRFGSTRGSLAQSTCKKSSNFVLGRLIRNLQRQRFDEASVCIRDVIEMQFRDDEEEEEKEQEGERDCFNQYLDGALVVIYLVRQRGMRILRGVWQFSAKTL